MASSDILIIKYFINIRQNILKLKHADSQTDRQTHVLDLPYVHFYAQHNKWICRSASMRTIVLHNPSFLNEIVESGILRWSRAESWHSVGRRNHAATSSTPVKSVKHMSRIAGNSQKSNLFFSRWKHKVNSLNTRSYSKLNWSTLLINPKTLYLTQFLTIFIYKNDSQNATLFSLY
jgi:hypothetical protein